MAELFKDIQQYGWSHDVQRFYKRSGHKGKDQCQPFPMRNDSKDQRRGRGKENKQPYSPVFLWLFHLKKFTQK